MKDAARSAPPRPMSPPGCALRSMPSWGPSSTSVQASSCAGPSKKPSSDTDIIKMIFLIARGLRRHAIGSEVVVLVVLWSFRRLGVVDVGHLHLAGAVIDVHRRRVQDNVTTDVGADLGTGSAARTAGSLQVERAQMVTHRRSLAAVWAPLKRRALFDLLHAS